MNVTTTAKDYIKHEINDDDYSDPLRFSGFHGLPPDKQAFAISNQFEHQQEDFIKCNLEEINVNLEPQSVPLETIYIKHELLAHSDDNEQATNFWNSKISSDTAEGEHSLAYPGKSNLSEESNVLNRDFKKETIGVAYDAGGNDFVDGESEFPGPIFDDNKSKNIYNQTKECNVSVARLSTHTNLNLNNHMRDHTSERPCCYNVCDLSQKESLDKRENSSGLSSTPTAIMGKISQDIHYAINDEFVKEEQELTFKTETDEALRLKEGNSYNNDEERSNDCKIGTWVDVKEETRSITDDADGNNKLLNLTSAKSLQTTNKKPESVKHNGSKNLSKRGQARCTTKSFSCKICKYSTTSKSNLISHMQIHTGEKPFQCDVCEYSAVHKHHLIEHMRTHTGEKPFQCKICDYKAVRKTDLINHMRTHTGEKPFQCNVCDYRAAQKQQLISHMRSHSGEKPFQCNVCDYRAVHNQNLIKHMRTHTGEKPFQCEVCDYRAVHKQHLINHIRTHTGEKPFQCNACEYRTIHKHHLMKHMRTHTGEKPFKCNVCDYRAVQKQNLIRHMRIHTSEKQ